MLKHFHMTRLQRLVVLRWTLYCLLFLFVLLTEDIVLGKLPVFGTKLHPLPLVIICVCIREGPESGGLFALLATVFWYLSGADYGNLSVAILPICSIIAAILCRSVLTIRFVTTLLSCFVISMLNESVIFVFKMLLSAVGPENFLLVLLPGVMLSLLTVPLLYLAAKAISRIGVRHDL